MKNEKIIPNIAIPITASMDTVPDHCLGTNAPMNRVAMSIWVGHLPLQREKLLVIIAISFSRGLLIIRVATTPAALQPNPILIVRACLPCAPARRKSLSKLKATRGR